MRLIALFSILTLIGLNAAAQALPDSVRVMKAVVTDLDTMATIQLGECVISNDSDFQRRYQKRYWKTERKVIKVYPYAQAAGELMKDYEADLAKIHGKRAQKKYIKSAEDQLKEEFEGEIRRMTVSEGLILIKLIDRQTGDTSFELIKELKGSFSAFLWQSVARLFGSNLKEDYDPEVEDRIIEDVVRRIERGDIKIPARRNDLSDGNR
ncbi:MAG: DUF4294 domain-containing protein [Saprospiraceae bacterium]|nr:DUF4294 domain-containing protein [Saprospiraceae bacterium]